jgi:predicted AlkP superfamily phosphohydrolase/phosphomutase/Tfp pilus assembly protein PilF
VTLLAAALPLPGSPKPSAASRPRVVLVGWDGADWKLLDPLLKEGRLPNLAALVARGRTWNFDTYQPMSSPLIWTTVATGRTPVDHGVLDFEELDPKTRAKLPISGRSRKVPAIWNLASAKGVTVGVVGWWATWPAEKVNGFFVSDRAASILFDFEELAKSPALTWPEGLADGVRLLGRREGMPPYEDVAQALHVSRAEFDAAVAAKKSLSNPITGYRKILGSTRVVGKVAFELYDRYDPQLLMVYFEGTDAVGHILARYEPPKMLEESEEDFNSYKDGVAGLYVEADRILGELARRAQRDGATLILASDHGFRQGSDRPAFSSAADTAYEWHEQPGILVAAGPAVAHSGVRGRASVFDLTPTLCRMLDLPVDPAFAGKPIAGFSLRPARAPVAWERAAPVERLVVAADAEADKKLANEFTKQLISLGYLTGAESSAVEAQPTDRTGTQTSRSFQNASTFLRDRGKSAEAAAWDRKAHAVNTLEVNQNSATVWENLSTTLHQIGHYEESDDALVKALQSGCLDPEGTVSRRVKLYTAGPKGREQRRRLVSFLRKVVAAYPNNDRYPASLGKALFDDRDCASAQPILAELAERTPVDPENLNLLALTSLCLGDRSRAEDAFKRSLAVNPNQPVVKEGLTLLQKGQPLR